MNLIQYKHILHSNNNGNATPNIAMKLKTLCDTLTKGAIVRVHLRDAYAEPIILIAVSTEGKMFHQIANLTCLPAFLDVENLNNTLLLLITPCTPCLAKADVTYHVDKHSAADVMCTARSAMLGLTSAYDLHV